jgi:hypothetical protein
MVSACDYIFALDASQANPWRKRACQASESADLPSKAIFSSWLGHVWLLAADFAFVVMDFGIIMHAASPPSAYSPKSRYLPW